MLRKKGEGGGGEESGEETWGGRRQEGELEKWEEEMEGMRKGNRSRNRRGDMEIRSARPSDLSAEATRYPTPLPTPYLRRMCVTDTYTGMQRGWWWWYGDEVWDCWCGDGIL